MDIFVYNFYLERPRKCVGTYKLSYCLKGNKIATKYYFTIELRLQILNNKHCFEDKNFDWQIISFLSGQFGLRSFSCDVHSNRQYSIYSNSRKCTLKISPDKCRERKGIAAG